MKRSKGRDVWSWHSGAMQSRERVWRWEPKALKPKLESLLCVLGQVAASPWASASLSRESRLLVLEPQNCARVSMKKRI